MEVMYVNFAPLVSIMLLSITNSRLNSKLDSISFGELKPLGDRKFINSLKLLIRYRFDCWSSI